MSEAERQRRKSYKANRTRFIWIQAAILLLVACSIVACVVLRTLSNGTKDTVATYVEGGSVDYDVKYKPNDYFEEEWQPSGLSYVTELVEDIKAKFKYTYELDAPDLYYEFEYGLKMLIEIRDNTTKKIINSEEETLISGMKGTQCSNVPLEISVDQTIPFDEYNLRIMEMVETLRLDATSTIRLTLDVKTKTSAGVNNYTTSLVIPANQRTFETSTAASAPSGVENTVVIHEEPESKLITVLLIVLSSLELALFVLFVLYVVLTRNHDINYANKVRKLYSSYKSFIQRIVNGFDVEGYEILLVSSFNEMLSIRDTIQSPILMSENTDQTRTQFFIPTATKILYLYEIKVENYDEIYGSNPDWIDDSVIPYGGPVKIAVPITHEDGSLPAVKVPSVNIKPIG